MNFIWYAMDQNRIIYVTTHLSTVRIFMIYNQIFELIPIFSVYRKSFDRNGGPKQSISDDDYPHRPLRGPSNRILYYIMRWQKLKGLCRYARLGFAKLFTDNHYYSWWWMCIYVCMSYRIACRVNHNNSRALY